VQWQSFERLLLDASPNGAEMLKRDTTCDNGWRAPKHGEVMKNPTLAQTFRTLATQGKKGFYTGRVGEEIVKVVRDKGGYLTLDDLHHHMEHSGTEATEPIGLEFWLRGKRETPPDDGSRQHNDNAVMVWEHPPNGQGIVVLMALGILQALEDSGQIERWRRRDHNSSAHLHAVIESLRIAFADANWWITDPTKATVPVKEMISPEYMKERAKLFSADKACDRLRRGSPAQNCSDTVYFAATDIEGNAISFINSNYGEFGTGIVPKNCGFTLHNRGANFRLQDTYHPNNLAPRKRPYHTIIPGLVTNAGDNSLHSVFGVMGGYMQPQGQVQVLLNQLVFGLTPQEALDAPRVCISAGGAGEERFEVEEVLVEEGIAETTITELVRLGHNVKMVVGMARSVFGRGQVIQRHVDPIERTTIWSAGSDPRGDGAATPQ
jgi:gamma-glutamyltranspeptidase/glutathione hydrolase